MNLPFKPEKASGVENLHLYKSNTKDNELFDKRFEKIVEAITKAILDEVGVKYNLQAKEDTDGRMLYRVMAGSYANKANADEQVERLKASGFDAVIMSYEK